jgi:hypothetical protein
MARCDKHWKTVALVKMSRNMCSLSQAKLITHLFVSTPSHKPFLLTVGKNSGERSLIFRLNITKYNILLKFLSLREAIFLQTTRHFIMNNDTHNNALMLYFSKCNLLHRSTLVIDHDIKNFPTLQEPFKSPEKILGQWRYRVFKYQINSKAT